MKEMDKIEGDVLDLETATFLVLHAYSQEKMESLKEIISQDEDKVTSEDHKNLRYFNRLINEYFRENQQLTEITKEELTQ